MQCSHCGCCCAQLLRDLPGFAQNVREPPFGYPYSVKARALLHAHFDRKKLPSKTLDPGTYFHPCTCTPLFYGHYTGQPALAGTLISELEEFVEAWFYCPHALAEPIQIREKMLEFSSAVLPEPSLYHRTYT